MTIAALARACGVDFGTSNSAVGCVSADGAVLLPLEDDAPLLPSVVFFDYEEDKVYFGQQALQVYMEGNEGRLMRSLKSLLGSSLLEGQTEVQGRALPFRSLLAFFIRELRLRATARTGVAFDHAVFGRPVFFVDHNPAADCLAQNTLEQIALECGFREVSFQFEPIAAAMDYESRIAKEELVLVVDIGGGTSDFSLVRLSPSRRAQTERASDVLASGGIHLGGTDFDRTLSLSQVMPLLGYKSSLHNGAEMPAAVFFDLATWHSINMLYTRKTWMNLQSIHRDAEPQTQGLLDRLFTLISQRAGHRLAMQVEQAKIELCQDRQTSLDLTHLEAGLQPCLYQAKYAIDMAPMMDNIALTAQQLLQDANLQANAIDTLYFTGGASGMGWLREQISRHFPCARHVEGNRFGSIACGLALEAARRYG